MRLSSLLTALVLLSLQTSLLAQVPRKVLVEHFTNTRCGICGGKNPGLFQNLEANPSVIHLAIHPSSPYSNCIFNVHNRDENDLRTTFYNIYGATPRLVIQGEVQPAGVNFAAANLFSGYQNQTSPFSLRVREIRKGTDSVKVAVTVRAVAAHSENQGTLFVAYAEDPIAYNAPNGEKNHRNVFRKAFSSTDGDPLTLPALGDSVVWEATIAVNSEWSLSNMKVVALLQDQLKLTLQAETTTELELQAATSIDREWVAGVTLYPNPVDNILVVEGLRNDWRVMDVSGKIWQAGKAEQTVLISSEQLPAGMYVLESEGVGFRFVKELPQKAAFFVG